MTSWEDEDLDAFTIKPATPAAALVGQWDDEDVEGGGEVKDSWEDEDAAPEEKPKIDTQKNFAKTSKKKPSGKKIIKKEEIKLAEEEASQPVQPLTYEERKKLQDIVERSDFDNAVDIFEGVDNDNEALFGPASATKVDADAFVPTTQADFKKFGSMLAEQLVVYQDNFSYIDCLKVLLKDATAASDPEEIKELISSLNVLVNERIKAQQPAKKKKAAAKRQAAAKSKESVRMDDEFSAF